MLSLLLDSELPLKVPDIIALLDLLSLDLISQTEIWYGRKKGMLAFYKLMQCNSLPLLYVNPIHALMYFISMDEFYLYMLQIRKLNCHFSFIYGNPKSIIKAEKHRNIIDPD